MPTKITATSAAKARIAGKSVAELARRPVAGTVTQTGLRPKKANAHANGADLGQGRVEAFNRAKADVAKRVKASKAKVGRPVNWDDEYPSANEPEVKKGIAEGIEHILKKFADVVAARELLRKQGNPLAISGRKVEAPTSPVQPTAERLAKGQDLVWRQIGNRKVKEFETNAAMLVRFKHLPREFRDALNVLAFSIAAARGVAVDDRDHSSAKLIGRNVYDGTPNGALGPREIPQVVIDAVTRCKRLIQHMPPELMGVLCHLLEEEIGSAEHREPLIKFGNKLNYNQPEQARAAGGALAYSALAVLHYELKQERAKVEEARYARNTAKKAG